MEDAFSCISPNWLNRAYIYNGSIGRIFHDFRYRLEQDEKEKKIYAATYSKICYELADDVQKRTFSWDEEGVAQLRDWLQECYDAFLQQESQQAD